MNIELPQELASQLEARVAASEEFNSVDEYVAYVLGQVLAQTADATTAAPAEDSEKMENPDDKAAQVQERLKSLGYLE